MQLAKFRAFASEVQQSGAVHSQTKVVAIYRLLRDVWYDEQDLPLTDGSLISDLRRTLDRGEHWRHRKSLSAYLPVAEYAAVVCATYRSASTKPTRNKLQRELRLCVERSANRFDATHDHMTGLLNSQEFERTIEAALARVSGSDLAPEGSVSAPTAASGVAILALDVDHFKQVNDNYGHIYGDVVLQALARRLESAAQALVAQSKDGLFVSLARPSGEEFLVGLWGSVDQERAKTISEQFRNAIAREPLPSSDEWATVARGDAAVQLPGLADRGITVSIGVASAKQAGASVDGVKHLRNQADKALYCAKTGGRNTVRHFDEILSRYGAIVEHDVEAGVVIIDIGREVNVRNGQEFLVFLPKFTGTVPFVQDDGRTRRTLGTYPRVSIGRVVVFEAQREISFCRVAQRDCIGALPPRASLEAVPLGTISHLVGNAAGLPSAPRLKLVSLGDLRSRAEMGRQAGFELKSAIFGIANAGALLDERGIVFINHCLARLYESIREVFELNVEIAQVHETQLALVSLVHSRATMLELCNRVLEKAAESVSKASRFCAGLFVPPEASEEDEPEPSALLSAEHAVEYAQFAVAVALARGNGIEVFTPATAASVLITARRERKFDQALRDYARFKELGIENASVENVAGLLAFESPQRDMELAIAASSRAVQLAPEDPTMIANCAYIHYYADDPMSAHRMFEKVRLLRPGSPLSDAYAIPEAESAFAAFMEDHAAVDHSRLEDLLKRAQARAREHNFADELMDIESHLLLL